jgi:peptidoglycan/LPS O-acetylase OafA/YrhL
MSATQHAGHEGHHGGHGYGRFAAMIAVSTVVMFVLMYLNTYAFDHVFWSQTRAWMALVMGATMGIVMLGFMWSMYPDRRKNWMIVAGCAAAFAVALFLVRSQAAVDEVSWMRAMIPHHSIAILTSERAHIADPQARDLSRRIIDTQKKEIEEMKALIRELEKRD